MSGGRLPIPKVRHVYLFGNDKQIFDVDGGQCFDGMSGHVLGPDNISSEYWWVDVPLRYEVKSRMALRLWPDRASPTQRPVAVWHNR